MAESGGTASRSAARGLPGDAELLATLQQAVAEVFASMVCQFEQCAVFRELPQEHVDEDGEVDLVVDANSGKRLHIDREAVVEFRGLLDGRVVLRCAADGALDIARGLLMLEDDAGLAVEEVNDALKECANMLCGFMKSRALDPHGTFTMSVPFIKEAPRDPIGAACGALVYRLQQGTISLEIWRRDKPLAGAA